MGVLCPCSTKGSYIFLSLLENFLLYKISSKSCPKSQVHRPKLGSFPSSLQNITILESFQQAGSITFTEFIAVRCCGWKSLHGSEGKIPWGLLWADHDNSLPWNQFVPGSTGRCLIYSCRVCSLPWVHLWPLLDIGYMKPWSAWY